MPTTARKRTGIAAPATRGDMSHGFDAALGELTPTERVYRAKPDMPLRDYVAGAWHIVEPRQRFVPGRHIDAISEHLTAASQGEIRSLIINMPPRHMKSLLVSVFWPTWEWSYAPYIRYLFSSYAETLAIRDSLKCRRIILNPWYQRRYGEVYQLTADQNQKTRFDNDATGYRIATSVGGLGTGEGGDRIVVDDPHNARETQSEIKREVVLTWWGEQMSTRGNDPETVVRVVVMQRLHERDLTGYILAKEMGYEHLVLPAEYDGRKQVTTLGWKDWRKTEGELLWPERFTRKSINELKVELGSYAAAAQLQQRPAPSKGAIFNRDNFFYYTTADHPIPGVHTMPVTVEGSAQSWDAAFKGDKANKAKKELGSDYVVGNVWSWSGANMYLRAESRGQWEFPETIKEVLDLSEKWPSARAKWIEEKANGAAIISTLRSSVPGLIPVLTEDLGGDKVARARSVAPYSESHNIYVPHPDIATFDVEAWFLEIESFPRAQYDDRVDAMVQAVLMIIKMLGKSRWRDRQDAKDTTDGRGVPSTAAIIRGRF
jgi:predicted phage terminase large subunit-like protein